MIAVCNTLYFKVPDPVEHDEYDSEHFNPEYGSMCYTNFPTHCSGACC